MNNCECVAKKCDHDDTQFTPSSCKHHVLPGLFILPAAPVYAQSALPKVWFLDQQHQHQQASC